MRIIQGKLKGKEVRLEAPAEPRQAAVVDLMERLRRSLDQAASRHARGSKARAKKPTARKRTRRAA